jgi:methyl-accepting chemotaxis protein
MQGQGEGSGDRQQLSRNSSDMAGKLKDKLLKNRMLKVQDYKMALEFLVTSKYTIDCKELSIKSLSIVLLHLAQTQGIAKPVQKHLCAIAIVMEEIDDKNTAREVVDRVVEELGRMVEKFLEIVEAARRVVDNVERMAVTVSEEAVKKIRDLTLGMEVAFSGQQQGHILGPSGGGTYATVAVVAKYSPIYVVALTRGDIKAKQILIDGD